MNIDYAPVTINRYKNVLKKLENSIPTFYDKEDITFHELTPEFIKAFDLHLKTEVGLCRNTIVRYMKCFKKIKYGTGKRLDEERCVLWIQNGTG